MEELIIDRESLYISPIAQPISGEKLEQKLFKMTEKFIDIKGVKRGVKEVGKSIRKGASGICIFAADVSPVDVISHLPIQCESKKIPYIFVRSRVQLGLSASTKRPTSVILLVDPPKDSPMAKKFFKIKKKLMSIQHNE